MDRVGSRRTLHFPPMLAEPEEHAEPEKLAGTDPSPERAEPSAPSATPLADPLLLAWRTTSVDGHRVRYAVVGHGPAGDLPPRMGSPTQLLPRGDPRHGRRRLPCVRALASRASAARPSSTPKDRSFAGYGRWVGRFLDAVGEENVALVAGHSFGGGVATAFAHAQPDRVASLLLANAVGSPTWALFPNEVRTMVQRPFWDWTRHFTGDLLSTPRRFRLLPTLLEDFAVNLLRQPARHDPRRRVHPPGRPGRRGPVDRRLGASRCRSRGPTATDWSRARPSTTSAAPPVSRAW